MIWHCSFLPGFTACDIPKKTWDTGNQAGREHRKVPDKETESPQQQDTNQHMKIENNIPNSLLVQAS